MAILFAAASNESLAMAGTLNQTQNVTGSSLMAWVYAVSWANTENYIVGFATGTSATSARQILSGRNTNSWRTTNRRLDADSSTIVDSAASSAGTGAWYHVACVSTWNGASCVIYVNGQPSNSAAPAAWTAATSNTAATNAAVGARGDLSTSHDWDGHLEDVRVYNRALSAGEIATIYAARGTDGLINNLVNKWHLFGPAGGNVPSGAGAAAQDMMGRNNLTQANTPVYSTISRVSWRR